MPASELSRLGGFTSASAIQAAENATKGMQQIEEMSDADVAEVEASAALFQEVERTTADLRGLLNTFCGINWLAAGMKKRQRDEFEAPLQGVIVSHEEKAFALLANGPDSFDAADPVRQHTFWPAFAEMWGAAREVAGREGVLHWEVAFPGVWRGWQDDRPEGRLRRGDRQPALGPYRSSKRPNGSNCGIARNCLWPRQQARQPPKALISATRSKKGTTPLPWSIDAGPSKTRRLKCGQNSAGLQRALSIA